MEDNNNSLDNIVNSVTAIASGIPAPIQRNLLKAFSQLCSATIEIPIAYLEGQAAIRRANTEARTNVIRKISENIIDNVDVPIEYSDKAIERYASKIVKQQINLDKVVEFAVSDVGNQNFSSDNDVKEISEEWLNVFEEAAKIRTSEDMQLIFGKILANEINQPGKFSLKTLEIVSKLDSVVANNFLQLAMVSLYSMKDNSVVTAYTSEFNSERRSFDFSEFNLSYTDLSELHEFGLLHINQSTINIIVEDENLIMYAGKVYEFKAADNVSVQKVIVEGLLLTRSGCELLNVLNIGYNHSFIEKVKKYFSRNSIILKEKIS